MSGELVDKGVDAEERDDPSANRRRARRRLGIGGAAVAVAAGALVATAPWSSDGDTSNGSAKSTSTTTARSSSGSVEEPTLSSRLIVGDLPDGYSVQWVDEPVDDGSIDELPLATNVLLAADGALADDGPWLTATVVLLDRFERKSFDPEAYVSTGDGVAVTVGDLKGSYVATDFSDHSVLAFGPVKEGYVVTFNSKGLTKADLLSIAGEMDLDESTSDALAWPLFGPAVDELRLQTVTSYTDASSGFGGGPLSVALGSFGGGTNVNYGSNDDTLSLSNSVPPAGMDVLTLARFGLSKAKDVTVHDLPAVIGEIGGGFGVSAVMWLEGGRLVTVVSGDGDGLLEIAESVRPADDSEWNALNDAAQTGDFGQPQQTWLIGVGELEDATTWLIEGSVGDGGDLTLCVNNSSVDSSGGGCTTGEPVGGPAVLDAGMLGMDGPTAEGYVAVVPNDVVGAVLRFTADDGAVTEVPLKVVRSDWSFQAAAIAVTSDGEIRVVSADGTVLTTLTVSVQGTGPLTSDVTDFSS